MARSERANLRPAILDRLAGDDGPGSAYGSVAEYRRAVLRDVEWLLNHRRTIEPAPASCPEVRRSTYHYGLPDLTAFSADSGEALGEVRLLVEETIRTFEPRLESVRVRIPEEDEDGPRRGVRFVIEGLLRMDPDPELIAFDTVLDPSHGGFEVSADA